MAEPRPTLYLGTKMKHCLCLRILFKPNLFIMIYSIDVSLLADHEVPGTGI